MRNKSQRAQGQMELFKKTAMPIVLPPESKQELIVALAELVLDYAEMYLSQKEMPNERKDNN